jgi:hypothetical protein
MYDALANFEPASPEVLAQALRAAAEGGLAVREAEAVKEVWRQSNIDENGLPALPSEVLERTLPKEGVSRMPLGTGGVLFAVKQGKDTHFKLAIDDPKATLALSTDLPGTHMFVSLNGSLQHYGTAVLDDAAPLEIHSPRRSALRVDMQEFSHDGRPARPKIDITSHTTQLLLSTTTRGADVALSHPEGTHNIVGRPALVEMLRAKPTPEPGLMLEKNRLSVHAQGNRVMVSAKMDDVIKNRSFATENKVFNAEEANAVNDEMKTIAREAQTQAERNRQQQMQRPKGGPMLN